MSIQQVEISVVLPVYNGQKFLRQSLDSVLSQLFRKYELLICDDGSTDNSVEIIESYKDDIMNLNCLEEVYKYHIRNPQAAFFLS